MKGKKKKLVLYIITLFIAVVFLLSPLLLRIPCIRTTVSWILQPLNLSEYKNSYISLVSSLLGSFLAITGALWTQRMISDSDEKAENEKIASVLYYDLNYACNRIKEIVEKTYEFKNDIIVGNRDNIVQLREIKRANRFSIDNNWKNDLIILRKEINQEEINALLDLYTKLTTLQRIVSTLAQESSANEDISAYKIMLDMIDVKEDEKKGNSFVLKESYSKILRKMQVLSKPDSARKENENK